MAVPWLLALSFVSSTAEAAERWALSGQALAMSAPALPGVVLGGVAEGRVALSSHLYWSLRAGGGAITDSNESWNLTQTHLLAVTGVGVAGRFGKARLAVELDAGALVLLEYARRHQADRLADANIPDRERRSSAVAPLVAMQLVLEVEFVEHWLLRFSAGPQATWLRVNDEPRLAAGVFTGVGVTRAF